MSWLDDEADKNKADEASIRHRVEILSRSNFWAALIQRLRDDVEAINAHEHWKTRLGNVGFPLRFEQAFTGEGYQISKSGFPAVAVAVKNAHDRIKIERNFHENPLSREFKSREDLVINTMGDSVVLITSENQALVVPEEAAKYILKVIIESLKITKPVP